MVATEPLANDSPPPAPSDPLAALPLPQILRRRKWSLVFGLGFGLVLGLTICAVAGPWYESTAQLLVIRKRLDRVPLGGPEQDQRPDDHLATHMLVITSPRVVGPAVAQGDLASLESLRHDDGLTQALHWATHWSAGRSPESSVEDRLTKRIIKALQVTSDAQKPGLSPSNEVLSLSYRGKVPEDCRTVLNAIIDSYRAFWKETSHKANAEALDLLGRAKGMLQEDLAAREASYREFRQAAPLLVKEKNGKTIQQERLYAIDTRRSLLRMRQSEIQAALAAIDKAIKGGRSSAEVLRLIAGFPAHQDVLTASLLTSPEPWNAGRGARVSLEEELINLKLQEGKLLEQYGPNHPEVRATRKRIDSVRTLIAPALAPSSEQPPAPARDQDYVTLKVQLLKQELQENQRAEESLAQLFRKEQAEVTAALSYEMQDEAYRQAIERTKVLYDGLVKQFQELESVRDYSRYDIQILAAPQPGEPALSRYVMVLGFALFVGLLVGLAWAWRGELADCNRRMANDPR